MIPKILMQRSRDPVPEYYKEQLSYNVPSSWKYENISNDEAFDWLTAHADHFPKFDIVTRYERLFAFSAGYAVDYFRYLYLYIYGGFIMDDDAMLVEPIEEIVKDYDIITAVANKAHMYLNGFLGATPKNEVIYQCILHLQNLKFYHAGESLQEPCIELKNAVEKYQDKYNCKVYDEIWSADMINDYGIAFDSCNWTARHGFTGFTFDLDSKKMIMLHYAEKKIIPNPYEVPHYYAI